MKSFFLFLVLTLGTLTSIGAQTIEGTFTNKWQAPTGESLEYILTLNADGTFAFESNRTFISNEARETIFAEGSYKLQNHLLTLITDTNKEISNELTQKLKIVRHAI